MAQHDYINKKPKNRKNTKQEPAKKPFPLLLTFIALVLVGGFAYGLWFVKNNADPDLVEKQANPTAEKQVEIANRDHLNLLKKLKSMKFKLK